MATPVRYDDPVKWMIKALDAIRLERNKEGLKYFALSAMVDRLVGFQEKLDAMGDDNFDEPGAVATSALTRPTLFTENGAIRLVLELAKSGDSLGTEDELSVLNSIAVEAEKKLAAGLISDEP